jgi:hypothetical protein
MAKQTEFEYSTPGTESAYRDFPFMITEPGLLEDFELGFFTFLYFRCNDKTYFTGQDSNKVGSLGKIAYWSYSKIHLSLGTSRTRISRTLQLFEIAGLIGYISRPNKRVTKADQVTYITRNDKHGIIGSNIYAQFIAPKPSQRDRLIEIVKQARLDLTACYFPDGTLRPGTDKWTKQKTMKTRSKAKKSRDREEQGE